MTNTKLIASFVLVTLLGAGAAGGGVWWFTTHQKKDAAASAEASAAPAAADGRKAYKYVNLDKVIVMLRRVPGDDAPHYLSADLVIATGEDKERTTKEHLPMLRSVAVKALSAFTMDKAAGMTVDQFAIEINRAFTDSYAEESRERPFSNVMIGKLIIE